MGELRSAEWSVISEQKSPRRWEANRQVVGGKEKLASRSGSDGWESEAGCFW